jgi:dolichyl-phosphate beta-glucosyltransferase
MQKVALIIPCYNEEKRLNIQAFLDYAAGSQLCDLVFIDDGSRDATLTILREIAEKNPDRIHVIALRNNRGKAEAVRQGVQYVKDESRYSHFGFWDADLAAPLEELENMAGNIGKYDIVIGSRWKRLGSTIRRRAFRHYGGRVFSTLASLVLNLSVYDTQCGAKIFRRPMAVLFEEEFISRWLFDLEILARYRNQYGNAKAANSIFEFPLGNWTHRDQSRIGIFFFFKIPFELFRIHLKYNLKRSGGA